MRWAIRHGGAVVALDAIRHSGDFVGVSVGREEGGVQ
jgi:hypothetical protein